MFRFVYFFTSVSVLVLKSPVHSQNSLKQIKLEEITTIQDGKYDIWVSILLTHHTSKLKPLLVLKQKGSNKCIIIPILFRHDRNKELNKCKYAKCEWMNNWIDEWINEWVILNENKAMYDSNFNIGFFVMHGMDSSQRHFTDSLVVSKSSSN